MRTQHETFTSIQSFLGWDFARLRAALAALRKRPTSEAFRHLERGLLRHLRMKEGAVTRFYAFERTGLGRAPTQVLEEERAAVERSLAELHAALDAGDAAAAAAAARDLDAVLERGPASKLADLYRLMDGLLGPVEAERLVAELQA
jgi:hypothetical protein